MKKFDDWNTEKKYLETSTKKPRYPKVKQIWFAKLGLNIGCESDGKAEFSRPVLVLSKIGNMYWCVPLTTKGKVNIFYHELESFKSSHAISRIMLSQCRTFDKKRFLECIGAISKAEFTTITKKLRSMYFSALD
jgi:mRNA interferase MazF